MVREISAGLRLDDRDQERQRDEDQGAGAPHLRAAGHVEQRHEGVERGSSGSVRPIFDSERVGSGGFAR
jgi:hypothetical protein